MQEGDDEEVEVDREGTATTSNNNDNIMTRHLRSSSGELNVFGRRHFIVHGGNFYRILTCPTVADRIMPWIFATILTNGKIAAVALIGIYLLWICLFLPFWLLSFVITEWGVYIAAIAFVFLVGRSIIRLIAFPGASRKVTTDIEAEFAKYSVRMIGTATSCFIDLARTFDPQSESNNNTNGGDYTLDHRTLYQLPMMWRRARGYRDRVLGVYLDVLNYIYNNESQQDAALPSTSLTLSVSNSQNHEDDAAPNHHPYGPGCTRYGNNRLSGDIGDFNQLTTKARMDGRELLDRLKRVLRLVDNLENSAHSVLQEGGAGPSTNTIAAETQRVAEELNQAASELRDFVSSLKPPSSDSGGGDENIEAAGNPGEDPTDAMRRRVEEQKNNPIAVVQTALASILPMLDPPPHTSIFGFDVQRGCMLSRYRGARQFWVQRPAGGMIDVLHFPAASRRSGQGTTPRSKKAVLYCNPNAGLVEVAVGLSFSGGNVPTADPDNAHDDTWVDYYTELGFDVYMFNYAGYGRSYGTTLCVNGRTDVGDQYPGCVARSWRIFRSSVLAFQPTPDTLRSDGVAVGQHLLTEGSIEQLIIHGESIGGVSASGAARYLSQNPAYASKLSLLICDRTFCNLEAIAQRLVGGWTGYAIRCLAPFWSTDVTGDFLATSCPKIVASDAADAIISEAASLKSGVALWKELHRGIATTKGIGWIPETPLQYRMADWENCCVNDSRYVAAESLFRAQPPVWPRDKHISFEEAFHFAACCKRIGKLAKALVGNSFDRDFAQSGSLSAQPLVVQAWIVLSCCDGLTGCTLGVGIKRGFDATVTWLCSCLVFGGQVVSDRARERVGQQAPEPGLEIVDGDFDGRPPGFEQLEQDSGIMYPKPIPKVVACLVSYLEAGDDSVLRLSHEFQFVVGVLHYVQTRLSAPATIQAALKSRQLHGFDESGVGSFLNLHCGHNNPFSRDERRTLALLLARATADVTVEVV